jgi:hypothetical protein
MSCLVYAALFLYMVYAGLTRMSTGGLEFMCFNSFRDRTWHMREHPIVTHMDLRYTIEWWTMEKLYILIYY